MINEEKLFDEFEPKECATQIEFDTHIREINARQRMLNQPYVDKIRDIDFEKSLVIGQIETLRSKLQQIKMERIRIEQEKKDINRTFYALKEQWFLLNPKGLKNED